MSISSDYLDVLILAAGKSKRMGGELSKVLLPLGSGRVIDSVLAQVSQCTVRKVGVVIGFKRDEVRAHLADRSILFVEQLEQRGTGHAILVSSPQFSDDCGHLLILNGDVPLLKVDTLHDFIHSHHRDRSPASLMTTRLENPTGYGRVIRGEDGRVHGIVEEKDAGEAERKITEINAGIYLFQKKYLFPYLDRLTCDNKAGEYYLTDVIGMLNAEGNYSNAFCVQDHREVLGMNTPEEYEEIKKLHRAFSFQKEDK